MASGVCPGVLGGGRNLGLTHREKMSLKTPRVLMPNYLGLLVWGVVYYILF